MEIVLIGGRVMSPQGDVPSSDFHDGAADLRIVDGGGHQLRHDPRAVATLLGWLDRQRNMAAASRR